MLRTNACDSISYEQVRPLTVPLLEQEPLQQLNATPMIWRCGELFFDQIQPGTPYLAVKRHGAIEEVFHWFGQERGCPGRSEHGKDVGTVSRMRQRACRIP